MWVDESNLEDESLKWGDKSSTEEQNDSTEDASEETSSDGDGIDLPILDSPIEGGRIDQNRLRDTVILPSKSHLCTRGIARRPQVLPTQVPVLAPLRPLTISN
ncbi:hypothetical protein AX15_006420 [Amanita polypyramis BW_CC]|nr:hypothetical protein AX15_006420 [Amanita polypyramis BW_CC]